MPFVFVALLTAAVILFAADPRRASTRWLSLTSLAGASGALAATIDFTIYPYVEKEWPQYSGLLPALYGVQAFSSLASYYLLPYAFLLFAIRYRADVALPAGWSRALPALLAIPIVLCVAFTPGYTEQMPVTFPLLAAWAVPYVAAGTALLLGRREVNRVLRRAHLTVCLAVLPAVVTFTFLNYVLQSFGFIGAWRHNTWVVAVAFAVFIYSIFRYGFMNIQFLVQARRLDSTLRAVTSGTAMLNHAIKNDVGKMRLFGEKIRRYAEQSGQRELREDIEVVLQTAEHMQELVMRVRERTQELPIRRETCRVRALCEDVLRALRPELERIEVTLEAPEALTVECDRAQTAEVLTNLVRNAAEAMPEGGALSIRAFETKRTVAVEVKDTGIGIERRDLRQVLEPFYTTKAGRATNFGLGLAYGYSVMRGHGGSLDLHSVPGKGTTVSVTFPKRERRKRP